MTSRLSAALQTLQWGNTELGRALSVNERTVRRWRAGQNDPPPGVLDWLDQLAAFHHGNPPPGAPRA